MRENYFEWGDYLLLLAVEFPRSSSELCCGDIVKIYMFIPLGHPVLELLYTLHTTVNSRCVFITNSFICISFIMLDWLDWLLIGWSSCSGVIGVAMLNRISWVYFVCLFFFYTQCRRQWRNDRDSLVHVINKRLFITVC